MMSPTQAKRVTYLYDRFMAAELKGWSSYDDYMLLLEWIDDPQLCRESEALYSIHKNKKMGCPFEHPKGTLCFVPGVLEGVEAILDLYEETGNLHPKNRYLLENYLCLCQDGQICELVDS